MKCILMRCCTWFDNSPEKGIADLIAFGAPFLANPDLPRRFALGAELNAPDHASMFGGGAQGYIDYPFLP